MSSLPWEIIETKAASAEENMAFDADLLHQLEENPRCILHFYSWRKKSITYGYFIQPQEVLHLEEIEKQDFELARRPTGGGIVFHVWDLAFSVLVSSLHPKFSQKPVENYYLVNCAVMQAVQSFLRENAPLELIEQDTSPLDLSCQKFCMARPTKYDVMLGEKKVAGASQRKLKTGFLHQGTIALTLPKKEDMKKLLLQESKVVDAMFLHTYPLLGLEADLTKLQQSREKLCTLLRKTITEI